MTVSNVDRVNSFDYRWDKCGRLLDCLMRDAAALATTGPAIPVPSASQRELEAERV